MPLDGLTAPALTGARGSAADRPAAAAVAVHTHAKRRRRLLAVGVAAISLVAAACGSTASSGAVAGATGSPLSASEQPSAESSDVPSAGPAQGFLTFQEENASKVFGGGTITDLGDGSSAVTLGVVAVGYADPLPARLVSGSCTDAASAPLPSYPPPPSAAPSGTPAESSAPSTAPTAAPSAAESLPAESAAPTPATLPVELTPVSAGGSNTVVQIALSDLLSAPTSVLVYKSAAEPTLVACSDVTAELVIPSTMPGPIESGQPSSAPSLPAASTTP